MRKFIGKKVKVETDGETTAPVVIVMKDRRWQVAAIEREWFDTGHGSTPVKARSWRTRRHRKNFVVRADNGDRLTLYYDYARDDKPTWQLVTVEENDA